MEIFHLYISIGLLTIVFNAHKVVRHQIEALRSLDNPLTNGHSCAFESIDELVECLNAYPLPPRLDHSGLRHLKDHPLLNRDTGG